MAILKLFGEKLFVVVRLWI